MNQKGPSKKKKGRSKKAQVLSAAVEGATDHFIEKGEEIANENEDIRADMMSAVDDVKKTGEASITGRMGGEHSELLSTQYLARCLEPGNVCHSITTRKTPKRRMKETQFTRHRITVEPMMLADNRKATLQAIHTDAVNKAVKDQKKNIVLDDLPHPINDSEKDLTRKERATLAQLRSGYFKLLGSYKSRIKKDASLNGCADCGKTPHDVKHIFACSAHPTTLIPLDIWSKPVESIREFSYLEEGNLD